MTESVNPENAESFFKNYMERLKVHYGHYLIAYKMSSRQSNNQIIMNSAQMIQFARAAGYKIRALAYVGNGDLNNAIADLNAAIMDLPNSANLYADRGAVYGEKGDFDKAIADLDKALQIKSDSADSYYYRSLAYLGKGNFECAFADCNKALKFSFIFEYNQLDAYLIRGFLYGMDGDFDKAITDFEAALRIKVENVGDDGTIEIESIFHNNARECLKYAREACTNSYLIKRLQEEKIDRQYKKYQDLLCKKENASHEDEFKNLHENFLEFGDYENAKALAIECNDRYNKLKEQREERERKEAAEKVAKEKAKESRRKIGKTIAIISIVLYAVMFFIGYFACPDDASGISFDLILMTAIFLIPFVVIFFAIGTVKRVVFLIGAIGLCIYFLANPGFLICHSVEISFAVTAIICNGVACGLAMKFPIWY
ncbi:MAG: tetratricopeptide repeat protein [Treponema sp.]|nr:tetratricopeptide repeat protein [Treponema sp.]